MSSLAVTAHPGKGVPAESLTPGTLFTFYVGATPRLGIRLVEGAGWWIEMGSNWCQCDTLEHNDFANVYPLEDNTTLTWWA